MLGGVLADAVGFRNLFFVTAAVEMAVAIAVMRLVRERRGGERRQASSVIENARWALRGATRAAIFALFGTQLAILLVQPFFALFVESLGVGRERLSSTTGAIFGVTGLATLVMAPRWGAFGDLIGRRRALWIAMGGASIAFALQGVVDDVRVLFCLRLLQGGFVAGMLPALYATIASRTPESRRAGVVAFGASATLLGGLVGPILGGTLASVFGMRPVFWISTGVFMTNALLAFFLPADGPPRVPGLRRSWELPTG
jgi:DHA1 family multidrug resistance protein-like MFS transporter